MIKDEVIHTATIDDPNMTKTTLIPAVQAQVAASLPCCKKRYCLVFTL